MSRNQQTGWIGIDLGASTVKLAQVVRCASGLRLRTALVSRTSPAGPQAAPGGESELADLGDEIRGALEARGGFRGRDAACMLSMPYTDLRAFSIPAGTPAERRAMVAHELAVALGESAAVRDFDFWETDSSLESGGVRLDNVNVLSLATSTTRQVASCFANAGLSLRVLDGLPTALARAAALGDLEEGPVAAVDWGFASATFCIAWNGRPLFTRQLRDCALAGLLDDVSRALELRPDEASQLLVTRGVAGQTPGDAPLDDVQVILTDIAAAHLARLADQITKTLAYLRVQRPGLTPRRCVLCGGGATVRNVTAALGEKLPLPTSAWSLRGAFDESPYWQPPVFAAAAALSTLAWKS
jgi:Tfp pilus assembly PilM family ATPase